MSISSRNTIVQKDRVLKSQLFSLFRVEPGFHYDISVTISRSPKILALSVVKFNFEKSING